jgi:hypothetical protein
MEAAGFGHDLAWAKSNFPKITLTRRTRGGTQLLEGQIGLFFPAASATGGKFRMVIHTHEFRQFEQAIALLNWAEDCIEITKLEKCIRPSRHTGSNCLCNKVASVQKLNCTPKRT